jgi:hypothetical protein
MFCIDASHASFKYLVGNRSIKVNEIITPQTMILRLLLVTGYQHLHKKNCTLFVVMMAGSGLKSAKKENGYIVQQTAMHRQGNHMINASSLELTLHKFGTV